MDPRASSPLPEEATVHVLSVAEIGARGGCDACYFKSPDCIGWYSKGACVCAEIEWACCKPGKEEGSMCICAKGELEFVQPTTCVKLTCQECCLDSRCAVPCDDEVPCIIACLSLQCVRDYKCDCKFGQSLAAGGATASAAKV